MNSTIDYFKNYLSEHKIINLVKKQLLHFIQLISPGGFLILHGPTGVGKSTLLKTLTKEIVKIFDIHYHFDAGSIPVLYVSAQADDLTKFSWKGFYKLALIELNEPLISKKRSFKSDSNDTINGYRDDEPGHEYKLRLKNAIKYRKTVVLVIDEAISILLSTKPEKYKLQLKIITGLSEFLNVRIILSSTYAIMDFLDMSTELTRRCRFLDFPRYKWESEVKGFVEVLNSFQTKMPIPCETELFKHTEFFYVGSAGCVGLLKDWLNAALLLAFTNNQKIVTLKNFQDSRMNLDDLKKIMREINDGEAQIASNNTTEYELKCLMGITKSKTKNSNTNKNASGNKVKVPVKSKKRPGERAPHRDHVGKPIIMQP